jgi:DNA-binding transcriptional MocR family regulator
MLAQSLAELAASPQFGNALKPIGAAGTPAARHAAARFLARSGWVPEPDNILFAGNGRQAIAAVFSALAKPGDRIAVEALTYPVAKGIAQRLGITLVPIDLDDEGMLPEALANAHVKAPLAAVYLQPSLHSPTGATMSMARRQSIANFLTETDTPAIEDAVYAFLVDDAPLASLSSNRVILIESLSKRIAPGLTLGLVAAPSKFVGRISTALRSGAWSPSGLPVAAGVAWMNDARTTEIITAKRADAQFRQVLARQALMPYMANGDPRAYHLWLHLPEPWRAEAFVAEAMKHGIALTPGSAFAVSPGYAPNFVRIALAAPPPADMIAALQRLRRLIEAGPVAEIE